MKCSRCGRRNKSGAIVCRNCGAALLPNAATTDAADLISRDTASALVSDGTTAYTDNSSSAAVNLASAKVKDAMAKRVSRKA